jgi:hypothetical protein
VIKFKSPEALFVAVIITTTVGESGNRRESFERPDILETALKEAALIIGDYLEPGRPPDPMAAIKRLIEVLDNQELADAIKRLDGRHALKVVK